jgi:hypothetical protein
MTWFSSVKSNTYMQRIGWSIRVQHELCGLYTVPENTHFNEFTAGEKCVQRAWQYGKRKEKQEDENKSQHNVLHTPRGVGNHLKPTCIESSLLVVEFLLSDRTVSVIGNVQIVHATIFLCYSKLND